MDVESEWKTLIRIKRARGGQLDRDERRTLDEIRHLELGRRVVDLPNRRIRVAFRKLFRT